MAKVIFSMTAGVPHGDDYTQPTGDTPISLGEVEGKSYFSIDDGNTTIKTDGANDSVYGVSVVSDADEKATLKASSNYVKDGITKWIDNWKNKGWKTHHQHSRIFDIGDH